MVGYIRPCFVVTTRLKGCSVKKALGIAILSIPFIVLTVVMFQNGGWETVGIVWAAVIGILAIVVVGTSLLMEE